MYAPKVGSSPRAARRIGTSPDRQVRFTSWSIRTHTNSRFKNSATSEVRMRLSTRLPTRLQLVPEKMNSGRLSRRASLMAEVSKTRQFTRCSRAGRIKSPGSADRESLRSSGTNGLAKVVMARIPTQKAATNAVAPYDCLELRVGMASIMGTAGGGHLLPAPIRAC